MRLHPVVFLLLEDAHWRQLAPEVESTAVGEQAERVRSSVPGGQLGGGGRPLPSGGAGTTSGCQGGSGSQGEGAGGGGGGGGGQGGSKPSSCVVA